MRRRAVTHRDHIDTETDTGDEGVKRRGHLKLRRACVFRCLEVQQTANALMKVVIQLPPGDEGVPNASLMKVVIQYTLQTPNSKTTFVLLCTRDTSTHRRIDT